MVEVKELFKKREEIFEKLSEEILNSIPNVLNGCKRFISDRGGDITKLSWETISYIEEPDVILLMGIVKHKVGDVVVMPDGTRTEVTDSNHEYFKSMLRLGIPYRLATSASDDEIYAFLNETLEEEGDHEIEQEPEEDFNLDELTDEQKDALEMFRTSGGGKS